MAFRAESRGIYTETSFLTEEEQFLLMKKKFCVGVCLKGGYREAERKIAVFGDEKTLGYPWEGSLAFLKIAPKHPKFAENLTHRDYLGSLMGLGIKREFLGDLILKNEEAYLVCLESIVSFLMQNLEKVRHTAVFLQQLEALPENCLPQTEESTAVSASSRLDALVAGVWNLSRSEAKALVEGEKVSVNGGVVTNPSKEIEAGSKISARGFGKFYFDGVLSETRSGRIRVRIRLFV